MEIEYSGDFGVFGVFEVCLELQRGQVVIRRKNNKKYSNMERQRMVHYKCKLYEET